MATNYNYFGCIDKNFKTLHNGEAMSYEVGQHISLTHLNQSREVALKRPKKSIEATVTQSQSAGQFLVEVGAQFRFKFTQSGLQAFRIIPVFSL